MGYNHGLEERKLAAEWKRLRREYAEAGMSEDAIDAMEAFDRECLKGDRRFYESTQRMDFRTVDGMDVENTSKSYRNKFGDRLQVDALITDPDRRYAWIDELDDEELVKAISVLSEKDLDMITAFAFEGYSQVEIAKRLGVSNRYVNKRIVRFGRILKKNIEAGRFSASPTGY